MKLGAFIFLFISAACMAQGQDYRKVANPLECKNSIQAHHYATSSLSANFTERIYSTMFDNSKKSVGKLLYKKDQKIRWEMVSPKKQIILINGSSIRVSEGGNEVRSASSGAVVKKIQKMMINLISGDFLNEKEFSISYFEDNSSYKLVLIPKSQGMSKYISSIILLFDKKNLVLNEMSLIESEADKIVYTFTNILLNESINDNKFVSF